MAEIKPALRRLDSLTSLRFFAAFAIVLYHCERYIEPLRPAQMVLGLAYTGVAFFFVLSGFVLTWSHRDGDRPVDFYWRRFARVWPLHFLTLLAAAVLIAWQGGDNSPVGLVLSVPLLQAWAPPGTLHYSFNGVSWSLSCEAFFYAVFPLLIGLALACRERARAAIAVISLLVLGAAGVMVVAPPRTWGFLIYINPAYRIGEFTVGMLLAAAIKQGWRPRFGVRSAVLTCAATYTVVSVVGWLRYDGILFRVPFAVADLAMLVPFCALIAAAASRDTTGGSGWLQSRPLILLGQWSFALYLVHEIVIRAVRPRDLGVDVMSGLGYAALAIGLSLATSGLAYHLFERPVELRLRGLRAGRDPQAAQAPASVGYRSDDAGP